MAQPGTDQHEGGVAVRETAYHPSAAADLPVQPFNDVNVPGSGGEVAAVVAAPVALALFVALVPGCLGQFLRSASNSSLSVSSTLPRTSSLICPLITSSFSCTIFSDMVCCLPSEWCVATSFYQRAPNHVSLFLRNLFYLPKGLYLLHAQSSFSKISFLSTDSLSLTLSVRKIVHHFHPSFLGRTMGKVLTRSQVSKKSSVAFLN